mgnify:CR=1 FL=1
MKFFKRQTIHERKVGDGSIILTADGNVEITPPSGEVTIDGNVNISGDASGPKTTDVLYVSQDGDDANDGRSEGKFGAKRTIKSAVEQSVPGTTIIVAPGDYYENNPITLPDFVTITGQGELRNTRIFPKNNTQTIFYVGNGCYLYQLTFRDGKDVAHKNGNPKDNKRKNLTVKPKSLNRSFARTSKAKKVNRRS